MKYVTQTKQHTQRDGHARTVTSRGGFTLIEMLVAVFIFSLTVVAFSAIASRGIFSIRNAINETTAFYLAQEGLEAVIARRDSNLLDTAVTWDDGFYSATSNPCSTSCSIDITTRPIGISSCSGSGCVVNKEVSTNRFVQKSGGGYDSTPFTRTITSLSVGTDTLRVTSRVEWMIGLKTYSVQLVQNITNWY